jgi:hypothetical protein
MKIESVKLKLKKKEIDYICNTILHLYLIDIKKGLHSDIDSLRDNIGFSNFILISKLCDIADIAFESQMESDILQYGK